MKTIAVFITIMLLMTGAFAQNSKLPGCCKKPF